MLVSFARQVYFLEGEDVYTILQTLHYFDPQRALKPSLRYETREPKSRTVLFFLIFFSQKTLPSDNSTLIQATAITLAQRTALICVHKSCHKNVLKTTNFWRYETFSTTAYHRNPLMRGRVMGGSDVCHRKERFTARELAWHSQTIRVGLYARLLDATPDYSMLGQTTREAGRHG